MAVALVLLLLPVCARAQGGFACPKAGTIVESAGGWKSVYDGPEPNYPVVCKVTDPHGRHLRRLYSWFNEDDIAPGGDRRARLALQMLFSGQKSEVTFDLIYYGMTVSQTWRRLGQETLILGGRPTDTIIYQRDEFFVLSKGSTPVGYGRSWKMWFDQSTGVFFKFKLMSMYGPGRPPLGEWEALSVTTP
jgi:hypothetical protein